MVVDPLSITEEKVSVKKVKEKRGESTVEVNKFIMEVTYVQPTHLTVMAQGITLKTTDANTRAKTWKSQAFNSDREVRDWWAIEKPNTMAAQTKGPVLTAVSSLQAELEDKHCTLEKTRGAEWHFPKSTGKVDYDDLRAAATRSAPPNSVRTRQPEKRRCARRRWSGTPHSAKPTSTTTRRASTGRWLDSSTSTSSRPPSSSRTSSAPKGTCWR